MKIRTKINLIFIVGVFIVVSATTVVVNYFGGNQLKQLNDNFISRLNDSKADQVRTFLKGEQEVLLSLSSSTVFRDFLKVPESSTQ